ncbi:homoserine kinase [Desulfovibrio ferrophilus]|uniref:Shikimate kinase n=1 Tax=Desulfovibrio ferrophilus TaxID=241368 RepID=A0A2Z6B0N1_9BACT|nr:homoserine kinase [Desulfovibrio ferrophilus]BBD09087.1 shikimate kinase [Desulfovibrio ferrophilus]
MVAFSTRQTDEGCVTLIGMAGAGKTTVGKALAEHLQWAHMDTDHLLESFFGRPLQDIFDALGRESFIRTEEEIVTQIFAKRAVISTGGSVIYGAEAIARLNTLGPLVHLDPGVETTCARVGGAQGRGLAIADGQTVQDLYNERKPLYEQIADLTLDTASLSPEDCARHIADWLAHQDKS